MKGTALLASLVVGLALCVGVAQADVLYDTLAGYDGGGGVSISGLDCVLKEYSSYAQPFTVSASTFTLSSVKIAALWFGYPYGNASSVSLSLLADNGGAPGTEIESLGIANTTRSASVIEFISSAHPLLEAGQTYWIGVLPAAANTWAGWCPVGSHTLGISANDKGSGWTVSANGVKLAMKVEATAAVPEPSSALLAMCGGIPCLAGFAARRRK